MDRNDRSRALPISLEVDGVRQRAVASSPFKWSARPVKRFDYPLHGIATGVTAGTSSNHRVVIRNGLTGRLADRGAFRLVRSGAAYIIWRAAVVNGRTLAGTAFCPQHENERVSVSLQVNGQTVASQAADGDDPPDFAWVDRKHSFSFNLEQLSSTLPSGSLPEAAVAFTFRVGEVQADTETIRAAELPLVTG